MSTPDQLAGDIAAELRVNTDETPVATASGDELLDSVRKQMEFYFSSENLRTDSYLTSRMDTDKTVPISVVMKVNLSLQITFSVLLTESSLSHLLVPKN